MIEGLEGLFSDPNGPAYQRREERVGPPLVYVQEKLGNSLRALHRLARALQADADSGARRYRAEDKDAALSGWDNPLSRATDAFYYGMVAYLALINMLAIANEDGLVERLLGFSEKEFDEWLEGIEAGGSVTG